MATVIPNAHVHVKPLDYDVEGNIHELMSQNPHNIGNVHKENLSCSIFKAHDTMYGFTAKDGEEYKAKISGAQMWLHPKTHKKQLVILLESDDLMNRHQEIQAQGFQSIYPEYVPHLTLQYDMPPGDSFKWWTNSIITMFNYGTASSYYGKEITLVNETIGDLSITKPIARQPIVLTV